MNQQKKPKTTLRLPLKRGSTAQTPFSTKNILATSKREFSMTYVIHNLFLKQEAFVNNNIKDIIKPTFVIKFIDFPGLEIVGNKLTMELFQTDKEYIEIKRRQIRQIRLQDEDFYRNEYEKVNFDITQGLNKDSAQQSERDQNKKFNEAKSMRKMKNKLLAEQNKLNSVPQSSNNDKQEPPLKLFVKKKSIEIDIEEVIETHVQKRGFEKGVTTRLRIPINEMKSYLGEYALLVEFRDGEQRYERQDGLEKKQKDLYIGQSQIAMQKFIEDCEYVVDDTDEKFRRNTFKILDSQKNILGWFDMSISILQRKIPGNNIISNFTDALLQNDTFRSGNSEILDSHAKSKSDRSPKGNVNFQFEEKNTRQSLIKIQSGVQSKDQTPSNKLNKSQKSIIQKQQSSKNQSQSQIPPASQYQQQQQKGENKKDDLQPYASFSQKDMFRNASQQIAENPKEIRNTESYDNDEFESVSQSIEQTPDRNNFNQKGTTGRQSLGEDEYALEFDPEMSLQSKVSFNKKDRQSSGKISNKFNESESGIQEEYASDFEASQSASKSQNSKRNNKNEDISENYDEIESQSLPQQYQKYTNRK